jgi:hypothetical protein
LQIEVSAGDHFPNRWDLPATLGPYGGFSSRRLPSEPPDLLQVTPARQSTNADRTPAELGHQLREPSICARPPAALRNAQHIEHDLCGHALDAIVANLTVQPFQL